MMRLLISFAALLCAGTTPPSSAFTFQHQRRRSSSPAAAAAFSRRPTSATSIRLQNAFVNVEEGQPRDVATMDQWAAGLEVRRCDGFQLTSDDGVDFGVATTEPLAAGSPVLQVPAQMVLSSTRCAQEFAGGAADEAVDQLTRLGAGDQKPLFYLFLKVLTEYQMGDQSPWFPWLNSLPRLYYNAVSMTDLCLECLPPLVFSLGRAERVKFDNFYEALQKFDGVSPEIKANRDVAKWAFNVVSTRSFGDANEKQIAPVADMFNHGTEPEIVLQTEENGDVMAYAMKDVPAGSPLRVSYGDPTNPSHLFATYGFLDETSPATFCKIMTIQPTPELKNLGLDFSRMLFYKDTGEISAEVFDVMLYKNLASNREVQQAFYEAHLNGDLDTKNAIHQQHFAQTSTAIKEHVDTFLKQLDELSAKAEGHDLGTHPRLPLILKHNEFVKNTFLMVKARLDPMVAQATGEPVEA